MNENFSGKSFARALHASGCTKSVVSHRLRLRFATHLLEAGTDIRTVQELMGQVEKKTKMIYLHVMNKPGLAVKSPLDRLKQSLGDSGSMTEGLSFPLWQVSPGPAVQDRERQAKRTLIDPASPINETLAEES